MHLVRPFSGHGLTRHTADNRIACQDEEPDMLLNERELSMTIMPPMWTNKTLRVLTR